MASVRSSLGLVFLLTTVLAPACKPGATGQGVRPPEMTAWEATGDQAGQCRVVSNFGEPLVVDWEAHQRANIEEAMHDGVAVVTYDCKSLRLLKGCRLDGSYGFMAVSKKEQVVRFENADEVAANLPTFGLPLVRQLRGDLSRDSTLDLAMILVGKRRTTVSEAGREKLVGAGACEGATHFVRGAFVGAFTMGTGTKGEASLGVGLFAASSRSSKLSKYRDGEAESCQQVKPGQDGPPASCSALLRLELVALGARTEKTPASSSEALPPDTCPAGLVQVEGKCTQLRSSEAHQCREGDVTDCSAQCQRGHAGSCATLGSLYYWGRGVAKDAPRSLALARQACEGGSARGCNNLGDFYGRGIGVAQDKARAATLYKQACDDGFASACANLGFLYDEGQGVTQDKARAAALYKKACDGGNPYGCNDLGSLYENGQGIAQDRERAAALYRKACDGGNDHGCGNLGFLYDQGRGVAQDRARAAVLYEQACHGKFSDYCNLLAVLYEKGQGVTQDRARAITLYKKACDGGFALACGNLERLRLSGLRSQSGSKAEGSSELSEKDLAATTVTSSSQTPSRCPASRSWSSRRPS